MFLHLARPRKLSKNIFEIVDKIHTNYLNGIVDSYLFCFIKNFYFYKCSMFFKGLYLWNEKLQSIANSSVFYIIHALLCHMTLLSKKEYCKTGYFRGHVIFAVSAVDRQSAKIN